MNLDFKRYMNELIYIIYIYFFLSASVIQRFYRKNNLEKLFKYSNISMISNDPEVKRSNYITSLRFNKKIQNNEHNIKK